MKNQTACFWVASFLVFTSIEAFAHDRTDWRTDRQAFRSVRKESSPRSRIFDTTSYPNLPIDQDFIQQKLAQLSGAAPVTINGKSVTIPERGGDLGRELARQFLAQEYAAIGFQVSTHVFSNGANFIAEKKGQDSSKVLIISSHLDSVRNAGANDDGVGTIAALAIARALSNRDLKMTLRVLAFDKEEIGLVGSSEYVSQLSRGPKVIGDIQMEMMATNQRKDGAFHIIDCDKAGSTELTDYIMNAVVALKLPLSRVSACTTRSDHSSFWDAGIPAIVLSENFFGGDSDPCYHAPCDVLDSRLDLTYATNITRAVGSAAAAILGVEQVVASNWKLKK